APAGVLAVCDQCCSRRGHGTRRTHPAGRRGRSSPPSPPTSGRGTTLARPVASSDLVDLPDLLAWPPQRGAVVGPLSSCRSRGRLIAVMPLPSCRERRRGRRTAEGRGREGAARRVGGVS